jgi:hypothetical protein
MFERAKAFHALDRAATVNGESYIEEKNLLLPEWNPGLYPVIIPTELSWLPLQMV